VIEDDIPTGEFLQRNLTQEGYAVDLALTGPDGEAMAEAYAYDALIMGVILAGKSGLDVLRSLRQKNILTPILMLTGLDTLDDEIRGLDLGADDYVTKPFKFSKVSARIRALLRRAPLTLNPQLKVGKLVLDSDTQEVWYEGHPVIVTRIEFAILALLMRHPNIVIKRSRIAENVWDVELCPESNAIDEHISNLRAKLAMDDPEDLIQTVRGVGYKLNIRGILHGRPLPCITIFLIGLFSTLHLQADLISSIVSSDV
jgi:DNA-binding response OmpR family regulator